MNERACDLHNSRGGGGHDLPAKWSHLSSLEPIMKCQNIGTKICDYKKWNSKYQGFMNFDPTV